METPLTNAPSTLTVAEMNRQLTIIQEQLADTTPRPAHVTANLERLAQLWRDKIEAVSE
jgi:hypothetical protein